MQIEFNCSCGTRMRTATANLGKRAKCPKCGNLVAIPSQLPPAHANKPTAQAVAKPVERISAKPVGPSAAAAGKPRVVARPVEPSPAVPAFDPLDFGNLPLPPTGPLTGGSAAQSGQWNAPAWNGASYAAPSRQSNQKALLIAGLGVVVTLLLVGVGFGVYKFAGSTLSSIASAGGSANSSGSRGNNGSSEDLANGKADNLDPAPASTSLRNVTPPITEAEANIIGNRFADAVRSMDRPTCERLFQFDETLDEILREAKLPSKEHAQFKLGFKSQPKIWDQVHMAVVADQGEYIMLRSLPRDGRIRPIIRFSSKSNGLNYNELVLARNSSGEPIIVDIFNLTTGETLGDTTRRIVLTMVATRDATLMGRLTGRSRQLAEYGKALEKISLQAKSNPRAALDEINRLPTELQQEKTLMLMRLTLSAKVDQNLAISAFESFKQLFPNDPCLDMHAIDYYMARNQNQQALESIEKLSRHVGGDPFLDKMIAAVKAM